MHQDSQRRNFGGIDLMRVLKFLDKLALIRRMKGLKIGEFSKLCNLTPERMEDILEGTHAPCAADVLRIMRALDIRFDPEDFEEAGL